MGEELIKIFRWLRSALLRTHRQPVVVLPARGSTYRGKVLYSYLAEPLSQDADDYFAGHSNKWESREIARIFQSLGYEVHALEWTNNEFVPTDSYTVIFDIYLNLQRLGSLVPDAIRLLHLTGSDWNFQNRAELMRIECMEKRRGGLYVPRRMVPYADLLGRIIGLAHCCSLVGNGFTLETYSSDVQSKIIPVGVSASQAFHKSPDCFVPEVKEFLWFFGGGLVHKGLDVVLEAFIANPTLTLNVIGDVFAEQDFVSIYQNELFNYSNIKVHGYLKPEEPRFLEIINRCFCFIAPSCSEGASPAVVTCMQIGLYPIISKNTGVTLPARAGRYLESCDVDEIAFIANDVYSLTNERLVAEIRSVQEYANINYSRAQFSENMRNYLRSSLGIFSE